MSSPRRNPAPRVTFHGVCASLDCPVDDPAPPGEAWCQYRLWVVELGRWFDPDFPMACGTPAPVTLPPVDATAPA